MRSLFEFLNPKKIIRIAEEFAYPTNYLYLVYFLTSLFFSPFIIFLSNIDRKYFKITNILQRIILRKIKTKEKNVFCIPPISGTFWKFTSFKEPETRHFLKALNPDIFIDVGAYLGIYTIMFARKGSKVFAFEPNPFSYRFLIKNIRLNKCKQNVKTFKLALSNKRGVRNFFVDIINSETSSLRRTHFQLKRFKTIAKCESLDTLLGNINFKNFSTVVKIDAEGHELEVLKGMRKILKNIKKSSHSLLIVEIWNRHKAEKVKNLLKKFKYKFNKVLDENNYVFIKS